MLIKSKIPNYLTIFRIILVPIILVFLVFNFGPKIYHLGLENIFENDVYLSFFIGGVLFLIASMTDWLDGFLARKYHWISDFGKFWDPIADKVLINSVLIVFACKNICPIFVPLLMIIRDVIVDAFRMTAAKKQIVIAANFYGKLKTVTQIIGIIFICFIMNETFESALNINIYAWYFIQNLMLLIATIFSIVSGLVYAFEIKKTIKKLKTN